MNESIKKSVGIGLITLGTYLMVFFNISNILYAETKAMILGITMLITLSITIGIVLRTEK